MISAVIFAHAHADVFSGMLRKSRRSASISSTRFNRRYARSLTGCFRPRRLTLARRGDGGADASDGLVIRKLLPEQDTGLIEASLSRADDLFITWSRNTKSCRLGPQGSGVGALLLVGIDQTATLNHGTVLSISGHGDRDGSQR